LWVPHSEDLRKSVLEMEHDSKIAEHFGRDKTYEKVTRNFWWPRMEADIDDYVTTCPVCRRNKASRHKRYGPLSALEYPEAPWTDIAMDFITALPLSRGVPQIWVIIDRFTKAAHFFALPTSADSAMLVEVFLKEVWRLHGLPNSVVSDRESKFTSKHWDEVMSD
jgi:transposase InsO family protein